MPSQVNARFDTPEFNDLKDRKPDDVTWADVVRAGVDVVEDGESG